jgi:hypothetical protein
MACAAVAAVRAGRKAQELVEHDTEISYLANSERQLAIERLLIRFGEALKSIPNQRLSIPTEVVLTPEDGPTRHVRSELRYPSDRAEGQHRRSHLTPDHAEDEGGSESHFVRARIRC